MGISFAPPFLLKLASTRSPLIDDAVIHTEIARMKLEQERQDHQDRGELFRGVVQAQKPPPPAQSLPFPELAAPPLGPQDRFTRPLTPPPAPPPAPPSGPGLPAGLASPPTGPMPQASGVIAPPDAPPPPPVDRPPGTFRLKPGEPLPPSVALDSVLGKKPNV